MSQENQAKVLLLERYMLNELSAGERDRLEKELREDPALRAQLEELRESNRQILQDYPPESQAPEILKKAAAKRQPLPARPAYSWFFRFCLPVVAAVVLLVILFPPLLNHKNGAMMTQNQATGTRIKGDKKPLPSLPELRIYRKNQNAAELLSGGFQARPGDLLQLSYSPGNYTHGIIFSIDGAGAVTLHFPESEIPETPLKREHQVFLPNAYQLDNAPRFERFFFIYGNEEIAVRDILAKAKILATNPAQAETGGIDLPKTLGQFSLLLRK